MIAVFYKSKKGLKPVHPHEAKKMLSAGLDLKTPEAFTLIAESEITIDTGVVIVCPEDIVDNLVTLAVPRSSSSKFDISLKNTIGVIDQDFRGPQNTIKLKIEKRKPYWQHVITLPSMDDYIAWVQKNGGRSFAKDFKVVTDNGSGSVSAFAPPSISPISHFEKGSKIAQLLFLPHLLKMVTIENFEKEYFDFCEELGIPVEDRGEFGSTGK